MISQANFSRRPLAWAAALTLLFALGSWLPAVQFFSRPSDYLPLHITLESVSVIVSAMVFGLAWNLRNEDRNGLTVVLGTAFLAIGLIDFAHTLSYQGMPEFITPSGPEKAINFWLAARLVGALAFIAVGCFNIKHIPSWQANIGFVLAIVLVAAIMHIGLFHAGSLPRTFVDGTGLTGFKIGAEYTLTALYVIAALLIARRARAERNDDLCWLAAASWTLALTELFLTFYASVTDAFNLLGHLYKAAAYLMVYRALFVTAVRGPQRALAAERERVAELEQRWKFAIEGSDQGVWDWNAATGTVYFSPRWKLMLGYAEDEVGDKLSEWESRVHPEDLPATRTDLERHFNGQAPYYENRHRMRTKDGSWRWILDRGMVVARDAAGKPSRVVGTHTDITDLIEAQQALTESEMRYRSILNAMAEGMLVQDASGRIVACNPAAEAILGMPAAELLQRSVDSPEWMLLHEDGSLFTGSEHPAMVALITGQSQRGVLMGVVQPHGTLVWISVNAEPLRHEGSSRPYAVASTFSDVSQRRQHDEAMRQSEARFRAIFDAAPAGVLMATTSGQIVQANPAVLRMFGYEPGEMARMNTLDITDPADRKTTHDYLDELAGGQRRSVQIEKRCVRKDGSVFWGSLLMTTLANENGGVIALLAIVEDIDERHHARLEVEESNRKLALSLAELARHDKEISHVNALYRQLQASETMEQVYAAVPAAIETLLGGRPGCLAVRDGDQGGFHVVARWGGETGIKDRFMAEECEAIRDAVPCCAEPGSRGACRHFEKDNSLRCHCVPLQVQGQTIGLLYLGDTDPTSHDQIVDMVAEAIKLTLSNLRLRHLLEHEASHDPLTGLFNRRSLSQMLPRELARAQRGGDSLAVAMVDADYFKRFNDTYGHEAGDKLLVELGRVFGERLRKSDFAARYGGEEFVIVLPDTQLDGALELLHDVAAAVARIRIGNAGVTVSMGVAMAPQHGDTEEALLRAADAAVYQAKANGRNRIEVAVAG